MTDSQIVLRVNDAKIVYDPETGVLKVFTGNPDTARSCVGRLIKEGLIGSLTALVLMPPGEKVFHLMLGSGVIEFIHPTPILISPPKKRLADLFEENIDPVLAAGVIIFCRKTGRFLLQVRSAKVKDPLKVGMWGGIIDLPESPAEAAARELLEEARIEVRPQMLIPLNRYTTKSLVYYRFLLLVREEFAPTVDHTEVDSYIWVRPDSLDKIPLHEGLAWLFKTDQTLKKLLEKKEPPTSMPIDFDQIVEDLLD